MALISGIELPAEKRIDIALTKIYGIGRKNVVGILEKAKVVASQKVKDLSEETTRAIQKAIEGLKLEGDLRAEVNDNIQRLKRIGSYKGLRHIRNLPVYGQRTRSNARTKRGRRTTIGALKKEAFEKMQQQTTGGTAATAKPEEKKKEEKRK